MPPRPGLSARKRGLAGRKGRRCRDLRRKTDPETHPKKWLANARGQVRANDRCRRKHLAHCILRIDFSAARPTVLGIELATAPAIATRIVGQVLACTAPASFTRTHAWLSGGYAQLNFSNESA